MAALLKWKEPRAVTDWELKHKYGPEFKSLLLLFWKWGFLIGVPVLYATWRYTPQGFRMVSQNFLLFCTFVPVSFLVLFCCAVKFFTSYGVDKKGLFKFGGSEWRYHWAEIESFRFENFPHVPNIRRLVITVRRGKY